MEKISKALVDGEAYRFRDATLEEQVNAILTMIGDLSNLDTEEKESLVGAVNELAAGVGGGLNETAAELLITILRNGIYSTDQSTNITALEAALAAGSSEDDSGDDTGGSEDSGGSDDSGGTEDDDTGGDDSGGEETVTYSISSALVNVTSTNPSAVVNEGDSYTATLTAADGYTLDGGTVSVSMGGEDITTSVYADGVVNIESVTGDVIVTASAVEEVSEEDSEAYNWTDGEAYVPENWTDGYILSSGTENENTSFSISDYLPCAGVAAFSGGTDLHYNHNYHCLYDADKKYIAPIISCNADTTLFGATFYGNTVSAKWVRYSSYTSKKTSEALIPHYFDELNDTTVPEEGKIYVIKDIKTGVYTAPTTGVESENTGYSTTGLVYCYGFKTWATADAFRKNVTYYDADKNYLSCITTTNNLYTGEIPESAVYMKISTAKVNGFYHLIILSKEVAE